MRLILIIPLLLITSIGWAGEKEDFIQKGDKRLEVSLKTYGSERRNTALHAIAYYLRAMLVKEETNEEIDFSSTDIKSVPSNLVGR